MSGAPHRNPPCFTDENQYNDWRYLNTKAGTSASYCADCTPSYKAAMVLSGRCRWPLTEFVTLPGNHLIGVRKFKQDVAA